MDTDMKSQGKARFMAGTVMGLSTAQPSRIIPDFGYLNMPEQ